MIRLGWFLEIIPPLWSGSRSVCPPACWAAPGHSPPFICLPETWNGLLVLLWCNNPKRLRWNLSAEFSSSHLRFLCCIFFFPFQLDVLTQHSCPATGAYVVIWGTAKPTRNTVGQETPKHKHGPREGGQTRMETFYVFLLLLFHWLCGYRLWLCRHWDELFP